MFKCLVGTKHTSCSDDLIVFCVRISSSFCIINKRKSKNIIIIHRGFIFFSSVSLKSKLLPYLHTNSSNGDLFVFEFSLIVLCLFVRQHIAWKPYTEIREKKNHRNKDRRRVKYPNRVNSQCFCVFKAILVYHPLSHYSSLLSVVHPSNTHLTFCVCTFKRNMILLDRINK